LGRDTTVRIEMRLTYIGPVPPIRSGIAQHGGYLAREFAEHHDVTVVSWQHQYPKLLFRRPQRDPDARPFPGARFMLRWWDPTSWWRAGRIAARSDVVVLAWTTPVHALPYRLILAMTRREPAVAIVHNAIPHETLPLQGPLTRWVLPRCARLVTHAHSVAAEAAEYAGDVDTIVVPMPPLLHVTPHPLPDSEELRLLFFGFVRPYKGLDVALDALAILRKQGVTPRLTVVGELWDREPVSVWEQRIAERGLEDQVDMQPRYMPDDEVDELIARHHAVLIPYRSATQSGIAPVAMAGGRPVIATAVGGLVDVVTDGVDGTLAAPSDPASLADAIQRCESQLAAMSAKALENAPSWADVADAALRDLPRAARPGGSGRP
jgi:glycosyltransferase involved in cell wall biosynthesis